VGLKGADESLIDENTGSGSAALDGQRGQARLRLELEYKPGLFVLVNEDFLLGRILKAGFRNLYNVVLEFEIRQAQLAGSSQLPLKSSVEKNFGVVLTGNDNQCAQVVAGLGERMTSSRNFRGYGIRNCGRSR